MTTEPFPTQPFTFTRNAARSGGGGQGGGSGPIVVVVVLLVVVVVTVLVVVVVVRVVVVVVVVVRRVVVVVVVVVVLEVVEVVVVVVVVEQVFVQSSVSFALPSSHASPSLTMPSPQKVQSGRQLRPGGDPGLNWGPSHCSRGSVAVAWRMPSPQKVLAMPTASVPGRHAPWPAGALAGNVVRSQVSPDVLWMARSPQNVQASIDGGQGP